MDKQARLTALHLAMSECKDAQEQCTYSARLALEKQEYDHLTKNAEKLRYLHMHMKDLIVEAKRLEEMIEEEIKEIL